MHAIAAQDADHVMQDVDARKGHGPQCEGGKEAHERRCRRKVADRRCRDANPDDEAASVGGQIGIGALEASEEGRQIVGAGDDREGQREEQRAQHQRAGRRSSFQQIDENFDAQEESYAQQKRHEEAAVIGAIHGTLARMFPRGLEGWRAALQGIHGHACEQEDKAPQASLCGGCRDSAQNRSKTDGQVSQHRWQICDQRRDGCQQADQGEQPIEPGIA